MSGYSLIKIFRTLLLFNFTQTKLFSLFCGLRGIIRPASSRIRYEPFWFWSPFRLMQTKNPISLFTEEVFLFCGVRGIRTPGTNCSVRQFSKLVVSATHPSHQKLCFKQVDKSNIKISFWQFLLNYISEFLNLSPQLFDYQLIDSQIINISANFRAFEIFG